MISFIESGLFPPNLTLPKGQLDPSSGKYKMDLASLSLAASITACGGCCRKVSSVALVMSLVSTKSSSSIVCGLQVFLLEIVEMNISTPPKLNLLLLEGEQ